MKKLSSCLRLILATGLFLASACSDNLQAVKIYRGFPAGVVALGVEKKRDIHYFANFFALVDLYKGQLHRQQLIRKNPQESSFAIDYKFLLTRYAALQKKTPGLFVLFDSQQHDNVDGWQKLQEQGCPCFSQLDNALGETQLTNFCLGPNKDFVILLFEGGDIVTAKDFNVEAVVEMNPQKPCLFCQADDHSADEHQCDGCGKWGHTTSSCIPMSHSAKYPAPPPEEPHSEKDQQPEPEEEYDESQAAPPFQPPNDDSAPAPKPDRVKEDCPTCGELCRCLPPPHPSNVVPTDAPSCKACGKTHPETPDEKCCYTPLKANAPGAFPDPNKTVVYQTDRERFTHGQMSETPCCFCAPRGFKHTGYTHTCPGCRGTGHRSSNCQWKGQGPHHGPVFLHVAVVPTDKADDDVVFTGIDGMTKTHKEMKGPQCCFCDTPNGGHGGKGGYGHKCSECSNFGHRARDCKFIKAQEAHVPNNVANDTIVFEANTGASTAQFSHSEMLRSPCFLCGGQNNHSGAGAYGHKCSICKKFGHRGRDCKGGTKYPTKCGHCGGLVMVSITAAEFQSEKPIHTPEPCTNENCPSRNGPTPPG